MSEVSDWKQIDKENFHIDGLSLSAPQGSYWQKMMGAIARKFSAVDTKLEEVEGAYVYRGTKATEDALPATGNSVGDVWNVAENGHNYAWTGSEWDDLGGENSNTNIENETNWEWDTTPFLSETLESQYNYNPDIPYYAGKQINISNSVDNNNKLTHLLLIVDRVRPSYSGTPTTRNGSGLLFGLPIRGQNPNVNPINWYYIFGKSNSGTYEYNVKHFLCITPYHKFTKIKYFFHGYYDYTSAIDTSTLEAPFETILTNDLILNQPAIVISSDLGIGTTINAYTKRVN